MPMTEIRKEIGFKFKEVTAPSEDRKEFLVKGLFTDDSVDAHGDIITREATERALPAYKEWGNVRYMHQPIPVGKVTKAGEADGLAWNEIEVAVKKDFAKQEIEDGLLAGFSVGILVNFDALEYNEDTEGWIINDYLLGEISFVDHPANYAAKIESVDKALVKEAAAVSGERNLSKLVKLIQDGEIMKKKMAMEKEAEAPVEEVAEAEVEKEVENEIVEEESETVETESAPEVEVVVEAAVDETEEEVDEDVMAQLKDVVAQLKDVASMFAEVAKSFLPAEEEEKAEEVEVTEPVTESEPEASIEEEVLEDGSLTKQVVLDYDELAKALIRNSKEAEKDVAAHKGMISVEGEDIKSEPEVKKPVDLKAAVSKYLQTNK